MDWLTTVPKVELHVHLEGATDFATYLKLAQNNSVVCPFSTVTEARQQFRYSNLEHFLTLYRECISSIRQPADFVLLMQQFIQDRLAQNIKYCEFFVSLSSYMTRDMNPDTILSTISAMCQEAQQKYGLELRCIPDISRERTLPLAQKCLEAIIRNRNTYIIGVGLGGSEQNGCRMFAPLFAMARQMGLYVVAHAGETRDSIIIWEAINDLRVARIGHGIAAVSDSALMNYLATSQLPLEVCPTSNYYTGIIPAAESHPVHLMIKRGLNVTINSDDPVMFDTTLTKEFQLLRAHGVNEYALFVLLCNNVKASFMNDAAKVQWLTNLQTHFDTYNKQEAIREGK